MVVQMRLTWVSGDKEPQQVQYENRKQTSEVTTFTQDDMCSESLIPFPFNTYIIKIIYGNNVLLSGSNY